MKTHIEKDVQVEMGGASIVLTSDSGIVRLSADGLIALNEFAQKTPLLKALLDNRGGAIPGALEQSDIDMAEDEGHRGGYIEGREKGREEGHADGYAEGLRDGRKQASAAEVKA